MSNKNKYFIIRLWLFDFDREILKNFMHCILVNCIHFYFIIFVFIVKTKNFQFNDLVNICISHKNCLKDLDWTFVKVKDNYFYINIDHFKLEQQFLGTLDFILNMPELKTHKTKLSLFKSL